MLGIEDYGSDSDTSLPDSSNVPSTSKSVPKPQRAPKKITISLPTISSKLEDDDFKDDRPLKKQKIGAGSSSLFSMLPVPKESTPTSRSQMRSLGRNSGSDFSSHSAPNDSQKTSTHDVEEGQYTKFSKSADDLDELPSSSATLFRPTSVAKGKKNISLEEADVNRPSSQSHTKPVSAPSAPAVDFFSLGITKANSTTTRDSSQSLPSSSTSVPFSAAPELPTIEIPEPTPTDPYPGYYQLPSGAWAAYDVEYYGKFMKKWENDYNAHVRALEKGTIKGFEGLKDAAVEEIDALKEMERAREEIQEREARKAVTQGAGGGPVAPRMNINASKTSGVARSRHQLSTLLKEAYENREALEEKIAQGKRNRKEAGNKYGF